MKTSLIICILSSLAAAAPVGSVPAAMPQKLSVGLFEDTGQIWMQNSGTKWNIRYRYLAYPWATNYGSGPRDGQFVADFFNDTAAKGFMPGIAYYQIWDNPPAGTGQLQKSQNVAGMTEYFKDLKIFFQQAAKFGKPVLLVWEPDYMGYLRSSGTDASAAIASTGLPELAGLPNTVAGINYAVLALRKATGASNVVITAHISGWASGSDIFHFDTTSSLQPHVDLVYAFIKHALDPNLYTGDSFDLLSGDPLDRDAQFYQVDRGEDRWWTVGDNDSINSKSMNRYIEWLRLWNLKSGKRWVLWQIPLGNSNSPNTCAMGYKDNRTEYFFGPNSQAHLQKVVDVGVISLLFGEGASCQTTRMTDGDYLRLNARTYLAGSGIPLNGQVVDAGTPSSVDAGFTCTCTCIPNVLDAGVQPADAGKPDSGTVVDAGIPDAGKPDSGYPIVDAGTPDAGFGLAGFEFENSVQGFSVDNSTGVVTTTNTPVWSGFKSLAAAFNNSTGQISVQVVPTTIIPSAGVTITYHVWIPAGTPLASIQVYAQESSSTSWRWNAYWSPSSNLVTQGWNTFTVALPTNASKIQALGVQFDFGANHYSGTFYIDSITWNGATTQDDAGTIVPQPVDAGKPDSGTVSTPDAGTTPKPDGGTVGKAFRIQTIGDSTTESVDSSFRCRMYSDLTSQGYQPTFVGTLTHPYSRCGAVGAKHSGYAGWTAEDIATKSGDNMGIWIAQNYPDIVVYNSGTNTIRWWLTETGAQAGARQAGFIASLFTYKPDVKVVVWTINPQSQVSIPPNGQNSMTVYQQYNAAIKTAVANLKAQGKAIILVDSDTVLTSADTYDGVHPSYEAGFNKLGPALTTAIKTFLQ